MVARWLFYVTFLTVVLGAFGNTRIATAYLKSENVTGIVLFTETESGVHVTGTITGLSAGSYGFHVHELGDTSTCDAAGPHFNPVVRNHGGRDHDVRHVGDLGNVVFVGTENAVANLDFVDNIISLHGPNNILGRSLVLHEREDDLGLGGHETSLTTGNAGPRVACAVIGIKYPASPWNSGVHVTPSLALLIVAAIFVRV